MVFLIFFLSLLIGVNMFTGGVSDLTADFCCGNCGHVNKSVLARVLWSSEEVVSDCLNCGAVNTLIEVVDSPLITKIRPICG